MGPVINEPIHIEFYGMPGCGKSTVAAKVAENLKRKGISVREPSREVGNEINKGKRTVKKLFYTAKYCLLHPNKALRLSKLIKENAYSGKKYVVQFINLIPKIYQYGTAKNGTVYIWDEGLFQSAISLSINKKMQSDEALDRLTVFNETRSKVLPVYLKTDCETVLSRLSRRDNGNSRVDKEKDYEKKVALLQEFERSCEQLQTGMMIDYTSGSADDIAAGIENSIF